RATPGLVTHFAEPVSALPIQAEAAASNLRSAALLRSVAVEKAPSIRPVATALFLTNQAGNDDAVRRPARDVLRNLGARSNAPSLLEHGLAWSRTEVRGSGVHIPLSAPENVVSAW